ncbi:hypothetical protein K0J45_03060 [Shewanella alkalitolerans]|uniref:hypothetical protein n=1 Tax=Shewanella alkalitolerans TaxID=2864209 RepID=UPI001C6578C8|nr:hypothetical protein [Shewanella alkalitolerans]QYJ98237.1 hypothetical protein K0J45_03060 [Shewanella alkalitolerans]
MSSLLDSTGNDFPEKYSTDKAFEDFVAEECEPIGKGTSREVFSVKGKNYVVKKALKESDTTCNWREVTSYLNYVEDRYRLAQIHSWSESGMYLVMEKIEVDSVATSSFDYPAWVTDRKPTNIGRAYDKTIKLCDYASIKSPDLVYKSEFA